MNTFEQYIQESLKSIGKIRISKRVDPLNSHKYKMFRGLDRKNLGQVPFSQRDGVKPPKIPKTLSTFIRQMDVSNKMVDVAKKAPSGVWRISKSQVLDIAKKYKFNIPNDKKPMKHLGSTGIQMIRFKPNVYYLYKPRRHSKKKRMKSALGKKVGNIHLGM